MLVSAIVALVMAGVAPALVGAQQSATGMTSLVFDGVAVVDVEQGKLVPDQRVVITGNRIGAIGNVSAVKLPKGAQVVDARGKYLIPGLWDLHVHPRTLAHVFYPLFIANGVTGIRDAWSEVPLDTLVRWRGEILAGTRVGPPRQLLNGYKAVNEIGDIPFNELVDSLLDRKAHGANFLKMYPLNFTAAAAARRAGIPFGGHDNDIPAIEASDSGMVILDHISSTGGLDTFCLERQATIERCQPVAEHLRRNGTWWTPTWIRAPYGSYGDGPRSQPVLARFEEFIRGFWSDSAPHSGSHNYLRDDTADANLLAAPRGGSILDSLGFMYVVQRAGLPTLAATDAGMPVVRTVTPGFSLHAELALYVAEGMTPLEALQTATLNPAKMLHGTDSLGTVAPGKLADLVLLDADPLADITNTTTVRAVMANGRYFNRAALDELLIEAKRNP